MEKIVGNLKILNVTKTLTAATAEDFEFTVPSGGDGQILEATVHLKRASILSSYTTLDSEDIVVTGLEILKKEGSERTQLLDGTPNIKEFAGTGMLPRLFTVVETSENNEDIVIGVQNNDSVSVRVSLTLYLAVKTKIRDIAAQPSAREVRVERP